MQNLDIGDRVCISPETFTWLTPSGVMSFKSSGKRVLMGTIRELRHNSASRENGSVFAIVAIDDGVSMGFGHGGPVNGLNIINVVYLSKVQDAESRRVSIYAD